MTGDWSMLSNEKVRNFHSITANYYWTLDGSVGTQTRLNDRGREFGCQRGQTFTLFIEKSRPLCSTQPSLRLVPETLLCEGDNSPLSSVDDKNAWSYTSNSSYVFLHHALPCTTYILVG